MGQGPGSEPTTPTLPFGSSNKSGRWVAQPHTVMPSAQARPQEQWGLPPHSSQQRGQASPMGMRGGAAMRGGPSQARRLVPANRGVDAREGVGSARGQQALVGMCRAPAAASSPVCLPVRPPGQRRRRDLRLTVIHRPWMPRRVRRQWRGRRWRSRQRRSQQRRSRQRWHSAVERRLLSPPSSSTAPEPAPCASNNASSALPLRTLHLAA